MKIVNKIIRITFISVLFIIGVALIIFGFTKSFISLKYQENNSVNYKVFLKNNNYFDTNYLDENRTYITSLIDHLNINYHYNLKFSEKVNGTYSYRIDAIVNANKPNGEDGYYWSKKYNILEPTDVDIKNSDTIDINKEIDIDYNKYNAILEEFKKDYSISTDGVLKVQLTVESRATGEKYKDDIKIPSNLNLNIPLLEKAVEATIEKNAVSNDNIIVSEDSSLTKYKFASIILGILLILIDLVLVLSITVVRIKNKNNHLYLATLKKIVDAHDSIIANIDNLPDVSDLKVINVSSFSELLDVYNEVRMPINFYENKRHSRSVFMIINDNMCWRFILDKDSVENNDK